MSVCVCVWSVEVWGRQSYGCEERDFIYMCASLMEIFSFWFGTARAIKVNVCVEGFSGAAVTEPAVKVKINWSVERGADSCLFLSVRR